jgi:hypothetical protein
MMTESWIERLKRKILVYQGLGTAVVPKPGKSVKPPVDFKTMRTTQIEDQLRKSGMNETEIARLRGKIKRPK